METTVIKVTTKKLSERNVKVDMRVQVNNHRKYHGELGTILEFDNGCSCSQGWCMVLLDKKDDGDDIEEKFRYGESGDVSDLLQVVTEPPRPEKIIVPGESGDLVTPETVKIGLKVKIQPNSKFRHQSKAIGVIEYFTDSKEWVHVEFADGFSNGYRYGHKKVDDGASDLIIV